MSKPRNIESYPLTLLSLVAKLEQNGGVPLYIPFPSEKDASSFRREFYGLRDAIRRDGQMESHPFTIAARIFTRKNPDGSADVAVVSADTLPYAQALGTYLAGTIPSE